MGPRRYATLLDAAYVRLKGQNRRNVVIGGMTNSLGQVRNGDFLRFPRLPGGKPPCMVPSGRKDRAFDFFVSPATQARYITAAFKAFDARPEWFAGLGWFSLLDEPVTVPRGLRTGLMTHEGARKPAFTAYRRVR